MERREKIQGFIKKYIILKKRKPTDSIFAEKRSAVAITFALMLPLFWGMFAIAINVAYLYYAHELLAMGLDAASTFIPTYNGAWIYQGYAEQALVFTFCQSPSLGGNYTCPAGYNVAGSFLPWSVTPIKFLSITLNGAVIQAGGYVGCLLTDLFNMFTGTVGYFYATSVVKFLALGNIFGGI